MTVNDIKEMGAIYFEKLKTGLKKYDQRNMKMEKDEAEKYFLTMLESYGPECAYADFYYFRLPDGGSESVDECLTQAEIEYLKGIAPEEDRCMKDYFFKLDETLVKIIVKLNADEILFSTFYFLDNEEKGLKRKTFWGNYEKDYMVFLDKKED